MQRDDLIIDVGAHNGDDTAHYVAEGFRVVAIEANPALAAGLRHRFAPEIAVGRVTVLEVAIGAEAGTGTLWVGEAGSQFGAMDRGVAALHGPVSPVPVAVVAFGSVLAEHGVPHYLKIDIERADIHCLRALAPPHLPRYVSVEANGLEELTVLRDLGYTAFKVLDQSALLWPRSFPNATVRGRLAHRAWDLARRVGRRAVRQRYAPGSSGPFGERTPGPWRTYDAVARDWLSHTRGEREGTLNPRGWFDFHARL